MRRGMAGLLSVVMLLSLCLPADFCLYADAGSGISLYAETNESGDYRYKINEDGTATITGYGGEDTELVIPSEIEGYAVSAIGALAFYYRDSLTSIKIPNGVTSIGDHAFDGTAFLENRRKQNPLVIINGILIDGKTCEGDVSIPNGVTSIGYSAFSGCSSLTSIEIPSGVTSIGYSAFSGCSSLTSIEIPNGVTSIGDHAFDDCDSLTSIEIPNGVTSIGYSAFSGCSSLTSIEVPDSVTSIGGGAFSYCSSLTSIKIPKNVTKIGEGAFYGTNIEFADYTGTVDQWANIEFGDEYANPISGSGKLRINGNVVTDVVWTNMMQKNPYAFRAVKGITNIVINEGVSEIGERAFSGYSDLTRVTIPKSVTQIGGDAFAGTNISEVHYLGTIDEWVNIDFQPGYYSNGDHGYYYYDATNPLSVAEGKLLINDRPVTDVVINREEIGNLAFYNYKHLRSVTMENAVKIGNLAFSGTTLTDLTISDCVEESEYKEQDRYGERTETGYYAIGPAKNITLTSGSQKITAEMISNHKKTLESISIPGTVTYIGDSAFVGCAKLKKIVIPRNVTRIEYNAFTGCDITIVGYEGSYAQTYAAFLGLPFESADGTDCSHTYNDGKLTRDPSCTLEGLKTYTCTKCGNVKVETIKKTGHTYQTVTTPPSNGKDGKEEVKCTVCGAVRSSKVIKADTGKKENAGAKPKATTIKSLKKGKKRFTVKWKKQNAQISGYQIQYGTKRSFEKSKTVTVKGYKTTSKTIKSLSARKKYYVRIRTYKTSGGKKYYSSWSAAKSVTTK